MKFTKDAQPANIGHCNVIQKLRLLQRFVMDDEPKYDLVPLTSFLSKELVFEDTPCVPFDIEETQQLMTNQKIIRDHHVHHMNKIFPVAADSCGKILSISSLHLNAIFLLPVPPELGFPFF